VALANEESGITIVAQASGICMTSESVGIIMYKHVDGALRVLLVHPGGPFWRNKDAGAWSIPKGERVAGEDAEATARREFAEELGIEPAGPMRPLGRIRQRGGKQVEAFALEGDFDVDALSSNSFQIEWPPRSGRLATFPEVDRAEWFTLPAARQKINPGQRPLLDRLEALCLGGR
jgi:predicted NUDIX family NTP pyrophosphohydrolase